MQTIKTDKGGNVYLIADNGAILSVNGHPTFYGIISTLTGLAYPPIYYNDTW